MFARLAAIPGLVCRENAALKNYTRFGLGGPARLLADAPTEEALRAALDALRNEEHALIGGGSNLVVADAGFPGVVLRYTDDSLAFAFEILREAHVALTPGIDFGRNAEGYLRFCYANSLERIEEALSRIGRFLEARRP